MNDKRLVTILCSVLGFLLAGWMYWVSNVVLENSNKHDWMVTMQGQINENKENILLLHGRQ